MTVVAPAEVRKWIATRRNAGRTPRSIASMLYWTLFPTAIAAGVFGGPISDVLEALGQAQPAGDATTAVSGVAALLLIYAVLLSVLRAVGPVTVSRQDVMWLVLSPLNRRKVLARSVGLLIAVVVVAAAVVGVAALTLLPIPPVDASGVLTALAIGASGGLLMVALTIGVQAFEFLQPWLRGLIALLVGLAVLAPVAAMVLPEETGLRIYEVLAHAGPWGWPAFLGRPGAAVIGAVALAVIVGAWRLIARVPTRSLLESSAMTGTIADSVIGLEPSFLTHAAEVRYWRGRRVTSASWALVTRIARRWPGLRVPAALVAQDIRTLVRRPGRLALLACAALVPMLVAAAGIGQLVIVVVLIGGLASSGSAVSSVRRESDSPALLALMGIGPGDVLRARAVLPSVVSALWCGVALTCLTAVDQLPPGPWWLLGLACGPAFGVAALRMARRGPVRNDLPAASTPMGTVQSGPFTWAVTGLDLAVLLTAPTLIVLALRDRIEFLDTTVVIVQVTLMATGVWIYLRAATPVRSWLRQQS